MKICFPVQRNEGLESRVYEHFGTAPIFVVVDSDTGDISAISNRDMQHAHGACNPVGALAGERVDGVIVGGIGGGALMKLNTVGIDVYGAEARTVQENLMLYNAGGLQKFQSARTCSGHGGRCAH